VIILFATVDRAKGPKGITAFLVEPGFPGFAIGKQERKMGIRASPTVALHLQDCEVPAENRLGEEGEGFRVAMRALDYTRPMIGAMAVGVAQAALDAATGYAKERRQFGQPIAALQGIQFMLAAWRCGPRGRSWCTTSEPGRPGRRRPILEPRWRTSPARTRR
jgi:alkylation response protein AidB-like acyl-CoA dehydrogenase